LGFDAKTQLQNPLFDVMGNTGTAFPLMLLVAALEEAKAGDRILLASYGNGSDAFVFQVNKQIEKIRDRRGMKGHLASKKVITDYMRYLRWRGLLPMEPGVKTVEFYSAVAAWRERDQNLRLEGTKCKVCGTVQFPPQRICTRCHAKDQMEPYHLADKKGKIATYVGDHITPMPEMPTITTEVDFEGGGRMECYTTDTMLEQLEIGSVVEMTFRKMRVEDGVHIYFWKSTSPRT
jgi:uncharacterized OB-fold protein